MKITQLQIEHAKQGDETCIASLIAKLLPVIHVQAAKASCPGLETEDAVQEGIIAVFRAVQSYDPQKGASFETYASGCIANAVRDARKAALRKKHSPLNESVPLEQQTVVAAGPEELAIQNEEYHLAMHKIHTQLSGFEKEVLLLFLDGYSYGAIAQKLEKPAKSIENAMVRVRRKLKAHRQSLSEYMP